jgi:hypothetical protein
MSMAWQIVLTILYALIAWTLGVLLARAFYKALYLKILVTQGKVPIIIELMTLLTVLATAVFLAFAGEVLVNILVPPKDDASLVIASTRLVIVIFTFSGMFYFQLYRDRKNLVEKLKDKKFLKQAIREMKSGQKPKK